MTDQALPGKKGLRKIGPPDERTSENYFLKRRKTL